MEYRSQNRTASIINARAECKRSPLSIEIFQISIKDNENTFALCLPLNDDITNVGKEFRVSNIQNQGIMHETETRKNGLLVGIRFFRLIISRLGVILNIHPQEY